MELYFFFLSVSTRVFTRSWSEETIQSKIPLSIICIAGYLPATVNAYTVWYNLGW